MEPGTSLGPYRIDRELGSGGMGKVYAATGPDGVVALKVVHEHVLETADAVQRFRREVEIGRTVDHPNVVRTFSGGEADGRHYLAMEYVEGQTLDGLLRELERVPEELCLHIGREVAKGLCAIHAVGAIHRDIKPENVLITPDHVVKIMDLGVARSMDDALRLSQTGAFVGSLHYAAPEQFEDGGARLDGRVDLHALGLVLYELVCGTPPYLADDLPRIVQKVLHEEPRRLGEINPQLSAFFEEVVHCLLAKDRDERFANAEVLGAVLESGEGSDWWHARARALQLETHRPIRRVRIPRETAVHGRETELARLRSRFERAKAGEGQVVLVEGEAGIGKSRLVDELIGRLQQDGEDINFLFGSYPPGGAATAAGGFSSAYREQFGEAGSAAYLPENQLLVPAFDALLRGEGAPEGAQLLTKPSLQTCFVRATQCLAAERVTIVLIDDLHFAPDEGRALFTSVAMGLPGHRVLLLGTTRPGVPEEWLTGLTRLDHADCLSVPRLGARDLVRLLRDSFRSERLAEQLGVKIAAKSDGNPFFAFEIIRGLREGQFITQQDDGTWVSTRVIDAIQIPSSVLDLVNARVAGLDDEERNLLDVAACWGYEFDASLIGEALGLRRLPVLQTMAKVEKRDRLVRSAGRHFVFDHHQVQEALYGALPEMLREEYHAALAEALESRTHAADQDPATLDGGLCVNLCEHYLEGGRGDLALRYLEAALGHLSEGYLHAQVVTLTERALAVPGLLEGVERARALVRLGPTLDAMGFRARQEKYAREAQSLAEEARDDELRSSAARALGTVFYRTSRREEARSAYRQSLELAHALGDRRAEAAATGALGSVFFTEGSLHSAQEHHERHLALSREIGSLRGEATATGNLGNVLYSGGRLQDAEAHYRRDLELSREIGDLGGEARATGNLGLVSKELGNLGRARSHFERSLALSREIGNRQFEAHATGNLGIVFAAKGRLSEAREHHERCLALSREIGDRSGETLARGFLASALYAEGHLREAREQYELQLMLSREIADRSNEAVACSNLGVVLAEQGLDGEAREHLLKAWVLLVEVGRHRRAHWNLPALIEAELRTGRIDAAQECVAERMAFARGDTDPVSEALALVVATRLPGADVAAAESAFATHGAEFDVRARMEAGLRLYEATGKSAYLEEAKLLLDATMAQVDDETRASMLTNLRMNREIKAAWREHGDSSAPA